MPYSLSTNVRQKPTPFISKTKYPPREYTLSVRSVYVVAHSGPMKYLLKT